MPWAFSDPPNVAVITTRRIIDGAATINFVSHDDDDGAWQFHNKTSEPLDINDAVVVGLSEIVELDKSLMELADLPLGWQASRASKNAPWERKQSQVSNRTT